MSLTRHNPCSIIWLQKHFHLLIALFIVLKKKVEDGEWNSRFWVLTSFNCEYVGVLVILCGGPMRMFSEMENCRGGGTLLLPMLLPALVKFILDVYYSMSAEC